MGSPREHLAKVSYFPGVRPPRDEEAHPDSGQGGWHVAGSDDYSDESTEAAQSTAGSEHDFGDHAVDVYEQHDVDDAPPRFEPEPLAPLHPAGKGRRGARATLSALGGGDASPAPDDARDGRATSYEVADVPEWEESESARADRERSADPRLAPAMERMSRLLAVEPGGGRTETRARGDAAGEAEIETEDDDALAARAERISMHALTRRGVSVSELRRTLTSRELPEHIVEAELARLERVGLLDDAELARTLVRTLTERKRLGRSALVGELKRRGLDSESIGLALDELDGDDEATRADELAQKRAPQLRSLDRITAERRLLGFLQRKGYSGSIAQTAVRKALGDSSSSGVRFE